MHFSFSSTGAQTGSYTFGSYGAVSSHTGTATTPLEYDAQYTDPHTTLIYLRARDYDTATAQFVEADPLVAQTGQPFAFAGNDPVDEADPSGLWSFNPIRDAEEATNDAENAAYDALTSGPGEDFASAVEGFGNAASLGLAGKVADAISSGSTCTEDTNSWFYRAGEMAGVAADAIATGGAEAAAEEAAAAEGASEGIYIVRSGADTYVGQSGNIANRLGQHVASGKFTQAEVDAAERISVLGGKTSREIAEQLTIDEFGGIENLLNKVNPIGPRRFDLLPDGYFR